MQDQTQQFCYLIINNQTELVLNSVLLCLSVFILGDAIRKFVKMRGSHNNDVTVVYSLLLIWWVIYGCHFAINITQYVLHNTISSQLMSQLSGYNHIINWLSAFFLQWILLYVPYHWSKQIMYLFSQIGNNIDRQSQITNDNNSYQGQQSKIYAVLKYYNYFRLLYLATCLIFLIHKSVAIIIVMLCLVLFDCVVINLTIFLGMYSLKFNQQLIQQLDNQEISKMFNQYLMIFVANNFRLALDTLLVVKSTVHQQFFIQKCQVQDSPQITSTIQSVLLCLFAHYLPIFIILRIYHLQEKPEEMGRSLIISNSENNVNQ